MVVPGNLDKTEEITLSQDLVVTELLQTLMVRQQQGQVVEEALHKVDRIQAGLVVQEVVEPEEVTHLELVLGNQVNQILAEVEALEMAPREMPLLVPEALELLS